MTLTEKEKEFWKKKANREPLKKLKGKINVIKKNYLKQKAIHLIYLRELSKRDTSK